MSVKCDPNKLHYQSGLYSASDHTTAAFVTDVHVVQIDCSLLANWDNLNKRMLLVVSDTRAKQVKEICI